MARIFSDKKKVKIIASLHEASLGYDLVRRMYLAGADAFKFDMSKFTELHCSKTMSIVSSIEQEFDASVAIVAELSGPKLRIGAFSEGFTQLRKGSTFVIDCEKEFGSSKRVSISHSEVLNSLDEELLIFIDNGKIVLKVKKNNGEKIETEVIVGGQLFGKREVRIPGKILPISPITSQDKRDINMLQYIGVDYIIFPKVQNEDDVKYIRSFLPPKTRLVSKIESACAVNDIESIAKNSDAIYISRFDLGIEVPVETIPNIQRALISKARENGCTAIVATQILESMVDSKVPTRTEVSDVDCAVLDGADAIVVSKDVLNGEYPVETVITMTKILESAEVDHRKDLDSGQQIVFRNSRTSTARVISMAACETIKLTGIKIIIAFTESGTTALNIASELPDATIIAMTPNQKTAKALSLVWGVHSIVIEELYSFSQMVQIAQKNVKKFCFARDAEKIAVVAGIPFREQGSTNLLHIFHAM